MNLMMVMSVTAGYGEDRKIRNKTGVGDRPEERREADILHKIPPFFSFMKCI